MSISCPLMSMKELLKAICLNSKNISTTYLSWKNKQNLKLPTISKTLQHCILDLCQNLTLTKSKVTIRKRNSKVIKKKKRTMWMSWDKSSWTKINSENMQSNTGRKRKIKEENDYDLNCFRICIFMIEIYLHSHSK